MYLGHKVVFLDKNLMLSTKKVFCHVSCLSVLLFVVGVLRRYIYYLNFFHHTCTRTIMGTSNRHRLTNPHGFSGNLSPGIPENPPFFLQKALHRS